MNAPIIHSALWRMPNGKNQYSAARTLPRVDMWGRIETETSMMNDDRRRSWPYR